MEANQFSMMLFPQSDEFKQFFIAMTKITLFLHCIKNIYHKQVQYNFFLILNSVSKSCQPHSLKANNILTIFIHQQYKMIGQPFKIEREEHRTTLIPQFHKHTLVWIHGLDQHHEKHMKNVITALGTHINQVKVIIPRAPDRFVTCKNQSVSSWFDIKFRSEKSFIVPFDQAFSSSEVIESYEKILKPIIQEQSVLIKDKGGKLIVCGFSQGCGMSLHSLFSLPNLVDFCIGISGYLFPFTPFDGALTEKLHIIYGLADDLRPWQYTKITYEGKIGSEKITMVEKMKHSFNEITQKVFENLLRQLLKEKPHL